MLPRENSLSVAFINCKMFIPLSSARTSVPLSNARTSAPFSVVTPTLNRLTSRDWSSLFLHRHASCACIHTCHCFKILFPAIDPYASSLVVLQSLMKYSPHFRMCLQSVCPQAQIISTPDFVDPCSEASCRYELLYSIFPILISASTYRCILNGLWPHLH